MRSNCQLAQVHVGDGAVFISELLGGEISPQNSQIPPIILRHVINHTFNTNTSPFKFACRLPILIS